LLFRVLQLPLSIAHIGLVLNHRRRTRKEKLAPEGKSERQVMFSQ
jgi:hypothetical protein